VTDPLRRIVGRTLDRFGEVIASRGAALSIRETGRVVRIARGVAIVDGLDTVKADELLQFPDGVVGQVFDVAVDHVGAVLLSSHEELVAGAEVRRTGRLADVPVGEGILSRVVDPLGQPLDERGRVEAVERWPIERPAPAIMDRAPVTVPLQTGIKVLDALIPIGRGQRELILGDRQTGKTAIAIDTILNQRDEEMVCIYCAIGQRSSAVAKLIDRLREHDALRYTAVVVATGEDPAGKQFLAPYAATSMAEFFVSRGRDVLIVYDDLTRHARAYRELSLLLRRPPGREAFPGDIFYVHSRLLERSTRLREELGGGSLTALPIIETEAQNVAGYIPTNLISITDGQVYLSPELFQKGILPAVDVGRSVSRVGGKTQLAAYRTVAPDLRLSYSQFEELEKFARFGTRLDQATKDQLVRGRRVREVLKQPRYSPLSAPEQIAVLTAVVGGVLDELPVERVGAAEHLLRQVMRNDFPDLCRRVLDNRELAAADRDLVVAALREAAAALVEES